MNWSRGLFRFWIIATVLWGIMIASIIWSDQPDIARGISRLAVFCRYDVEVSVSDDEQAVVTAVVASAAAAQRKSYCTDRDNPSGIPTQADLNYLKEHPEVAEKFRARFGALPGTGAATSTWPLSQAEVASALSSFREDQARHPAFVREILGMAVLFMAIPPAVVLALGWGLLWAFSGFRSNRTETLLAGDDATITTGLGRTPRTDRRPARACCLANTNRLCHAGRVRRSKCTPSCLVHFRTGSRNLQRQHARPATRAVHEQVCVRSRAAETVQRPRRSQLPQRKPFACADLQVLRASAQYYGTYDWGRNSILRTVIGYH